MAPNTGYNALKQELPSGNWDPDMHFGFDPPKDSWKRAQHNLPQIDSMLNQMPLQQQALQYQHYGQQFCGAMEPSLQSPLGPTVSNDQGPMDLTGMTVHLYHIDLPLCETRVTIITPPQIGVRRSLMDILVKEWETGNHSITPCQISIHCSMGIITFPDQLRYRQLIITILIHLPNIISYMAFEAANLPRRLIIAAILGWIIKVKT